MTKRDTKPENWDLGDLLTPTQRLTRDVPVNLRMLPPVEDVSIRDGYLIWKLAKPDKIVEGTRIFGVFSDVMQATLRNIRDRDETDMLRGFVRLHTLPDTEILEYARMWGQLRLCVHNVPHQHGPLVDVTKIRITIPPPDAGIVELVDREGLRSPGSICSPLLWEPIATWKFFSRQADAILKIAAHVNSEIPGPESEWKWVFARGLPDSPTRSGTIGLHRSFLLEALRAWMKMGSFHPWLRNLDGKVLLGGADLFAKLSLELAMAVSRTKAPTVCSVCGRQYDAIRKPAEGRSNYCSDPECRREGARLRKARSRRPTRKRKPIRAIRRNDRSETL